MLTTAHNENDTDSRCPFPPIPLAGIRARSMESAARSGSDPERRRARWLSQRTISRPWHLRTLPGGLGGAGIPILGADAVTVCRTAIPMPQRARHLWPCLRALIESARRNPCAQSGPVLAVTARPRLHWKCPARFPGGGADRRSANGRSGRGRERPLPVAVADRPKRLPYIPRVGPISSGLAPYDLTFLNPDSSGEHAMRLASLHRPR
jgi:hypothetical protein